MDNMIHTHPSKISHGERGFQWTARTGSTLSVQYGLINYCERRNVAKAYLDTEPNWRDIESHDFEMAVFYPDGFSVPISSGVEMVRGWLPAWAIPQIMNSMRYFHYGTMKGDCPYLKGFIYTLDQIESERDKEKSS